ncbi:MAG: zinc dependent phospholipase C family protein [Anaerolineae bacterium]|jgi:hypothetical protein|nr:zinc dependent phospholipase C family protein [Anaerolineae bacterium]
MATWIVHLRLAENLLKLIPNLDEGQFAIGNIAPDSGVPDENWENFDPPPTVTHFLSPTKVWFSSADLVFFRKCLVDIIPQEDKERFSFRLGYFFHLITDHLWLKMIDLPTQERFPDEFAADPKFIWKVKRDWYGLDLAYVRHHPESIFWHTFLNAQPTSCDLNFLPINALKQQLQYIKTFYKEHEKEIQRYSSPPYLYLTQEQVDDFVDKVTQRLFRIYQNIWVEKNPIPDGKSILSIVL